MSSYLDPIFIECLKKEPIGRTQKDLDIVFSYLKSFEATSYLKEPALRSLCKNARYERRGANDILYSRGEVTTSWYILLSGSVYIEGSMYLPRSSFGKKSAAGGRRTNECLILESSEMVVIDYPDVQLMRPEQRQSCSTMSLEKLLNYDTIHDVPEWPKYAPVGSELDQCPSSLSNPHYPRDDVYAKSDRSSRSSDTSSAYSGSDTMASIQSSIDAEEVDLSGLHETNVDSEEEDDLVECLETLSVRDSVRDCLEKDPTDRSEDDINILLEFTQKLRAFSNMTLSVRRALCSVMVFAVVEKAGTVVMNHGEELDSWSVIVNGFVEVQLPDGNVEELNLGDSFGITPTMEKMYHAGVMRTKVDDCQFVCITQCDYYKILHQGKENIRRVIEDGVTVLKSEERVHDGGTRKGAVVIQGTPDKLMEHLVESESSAVDPTFVEDFLLTYRTFIPSSIIVAKKLLHWFNDPMLRDKVTRVVLLWVNNHFTDFETDPEMIEFLEVFQAGLEQEKMNGQLRLLNIACEAKARARTVILARPSREQILNFSIQGGHDRGFGIFISNVEKNSRAEEIGLRRGDQILEVNGQNFSLTMLNRALEILRGNTHLSITVKSNLSGFKEMLKNPDKSPKSRHRKSSEIAKLQSDPKARLSTFNLLQGMTCSPPVPPPSNYTGKGRKHSTGDNKGFMTLGHKTKLKKALAKMNNITRNWIGDAILSGGGGGGSDDVLFPQQPNHTTPLFHSHSNPDLSSIFYEDGRHDYPEHVLKVYKADQTYKYLLIHKETTAREVVMLSLREFGIPDSSSQYSLCEVSAAEGAVKQRKLPDSLQNLAERIGLSSRYYLKNNESTEQLVPDDLAPELARESHVFLLQLNSVEVALQLTLEDFAIFRQIEATEYIDDLFGIRSKYGAPQLALFSELVNKEMFWVVTEVVFEHNLVKRMKIIKEFIKIARHLRECRNFNSMFAILSGLGHATVSRLKLTWDKLPTKYQKMFSDMQELMDPSRNMSRYRHLVNNENVQPPVIPFWPIVKKDLTFIHLGNDTKIDTLINFEKLRMIAKEVRNLTTMCSANYDMYTMIDSGGIPYPNPAMLSLNQLTTGSHMGATVKRRKNHVPNPKKMFEEAQMVRRVKAYLSKLKVVTDEETLRGRSLECEPNIQGSGGLSRRRQPSPTLSTASSNSSTSEGRRANTTKFGAPSPQSSRKLLALSDPTKTRPYQPPRVPHVSNSLSPTPSPGVGRRPIALTRVHAHERSQSDTSPGVLPVDLSVESSSVTSLNNIPLRKSHTSGSVTSCESSTRLYSETDSGHSYHFDSHSNSSVEGGTYSRSPPLFRRPVAVGHLPPPPRPRRPPDYSVAAKMAARSKNVTRTNSHEGVGYLRDDSDDGESGTVFLPWR